MRNMSSGREDTKRLLARHIDHTSLSGAESQEYIEKFVSAALDDETLLPASICVYPRWAELCKRKAGGRVPVAIVSNFPEGQQTADEVDAELRDIFEKAPNVVDEVDVVIDWRKCNEDICEGKKNIRTIVQAVKKVLQDAKRSKSPGIAGIVKVILETGEMTDHEVITQAAEEAALNGADFLKTSTGKKRGATKEAVQILCEVARRHKHVGVKVSGGVKTFEEACDYMALVQGGSQQRLNFRLGSSKLFTELKESLVKNGRTCPKQDDGLNSRRQREQEGLQGPR